MTSTLSYEEWTDKLKKEVDRRKEKIKDDWEKREYPLSKRELEEIEEAEEFFVSMTIKTEDPFVCMREDNRYYRAFFKCIEEKLEMDPSDFWHLIIPRKFAESIGLDPDKSKVYEVDDLLSDWYREDEIEYYNRIDTVYSAYDDANSEEFRIAITTYFAHEIIKANMAIVDFWKRCSDKLYVDYFDGALASEEVEAQYSSKMSKKAASQKGGETMSKKKQQRLLKIELYINGLPLDKLIAYQNLKSDNQLARNIHRSCRDLGVKEMTVKGYVHDIKMYINAAIAKIKSSQ